MSTKSDKETLYKSGMERAQEFCRANELSMPSVTRLATTDRLYHLATCAYYRPRIGISIMVEKCASPGLGGRAWSWPAYTVDRTPYGVIQHELGHHIDHTKSEPAKSLGDIKSLFSWKIWDASREAPMTGYLGTNEQAATFFMEWFAENFRLYVTNPDLSSRLRPKFYRALQATGVRPLATHDWETVLRQHAATDRIIEQARKKIAASFTDS